MNGFRFGGAGGDAAVGVASAALRPVGLGPPPAGTTGTPYSARIARMSACRRSIAASSRAFNASLPFSTPIEMSKASGTPGSSASGTSSSGAFRRVAA